MSTEKNLPDDNEQKIEKQLDQSPMYFSKLGMGL
jgi:hypothetical protein